MAAIELVTRSQIADRLGVTYQTVWSWERRGKLPSALRVDTRLGERHVWDWSEISQWWRVYNRHKAEFINTGALRP